MEPAKKKLKITSGNEENVKSRNDASAVLGETSKNSAIVRRDKESTSVHDNNKCKIVKMFETESVKIYSQLNTLIIIILKWLTEDDLNEIECMCRQWYILRKKVLKVPFYRAVLGFYCKCSKLQNTAAASICEILPNSVTHMKIDFWHCDCYGTMNFQELCICLGKKRSLKVLNFNHTMFSISLQSTIDLCRQFIPNLEVLSFHRPSFTDNFVKPEFEGLSKLKIFHIYDDFGIKTSSKLLFPKMSNLRNFSLIDIEVNNDWLEDNISVLQNIEMLNLKNSIISSKVIQTLKNFTLKLTELHLCDTNVKDSDFRFSNPVFPQLKTICLKHCDDVTCNGIVSLIISCHSLQRVYADGAVAKRYAMHPFVLKRPNKLQIVKHTNKCNALLTMDYMNYKKYIF